MMHTHPESNEALPGTLPRQSPPEEILFSLHGKPVRLRLRTGARRRLSELDVPLLVELELYFSCLVRKRVLFHEPATSLPDPGLPQVEALPGLLIRLRTVVTESCSIDGLDGAPPLKTMPVKRPSAMVPRWLRIDYGRRGWKGEFGY